MKEFRGRILRDISTEKATDFVQPSGLQKNVKEVFGPSLKILPDSYCLLAFECQDLSRNTATVGCAVHFLPLLL